MRKIYSLLVMGMALYASAQDPVGEVESKQLVIEKDKEIVLPKANKRMLSVGDLTIARDTGDIRFDRRVTSYDMPVVQPTLAPIRVDLDPAGIYRNYIKGGFGNYASPLITAYAGDQSGAFEWGGWAYHESFGRGAVDGRSSSSGKTMLDFFGTYTTDEWAVTPSIRAQNDFFKFYGTSDLTDVPRADVNRYQIGTKVHRVETDDWNLVFEPSYQYTGQRQGGGDFNSENHFLARLEGGYDIDSVFAITSEIKVGILDFGTAGERINRNYFMFNPRLTIRSGPWAFEGGVNIASTQDTLESNGFFYPHVGGSWSGLEGWNVYGEISGQLETFTFDQLSSVNPLLADSLTLLHQAVQSQLTAGIRGLATKKLFINTGIQLSSRENQGFFKPSVSDTSAFIYQIDTGSTTTIGLFGELNWQPFRGTSLRAGLHLYEYNTDNELEAWYEPTLRLGFQWNQQYGERFSTDLRIVSLRGIKAPVPITEEVITLDPIVDISVSAVYRWTDQISAFLELDNLFGQEYERYLNYPNRGASFKIGAIYRF